MVPLAMAAWRVYSILLPLMGLVLPVLLSVLD
nr:MAG TPA: PsaA, PsaB, PsaC, PsaD, PsaE-LHCI, PLANT PROTEIN [Caudoviricetes sp.]